jgi:hypothetical protein
MRIKQDAGSLMSRLTSLRLEWQLFALLSVDNGVKSVAAWRALRVSQDMERVLIAPSDAAWVAVYVLAKPRNAAGWPSTCLLSACLLSAMLRPQCSMLN